MTQTQQGQIRGAASPAWDTWLYVSSPACGPASAPGDGERESKGRISMVLVTGTDIHHPGTKKGLRRHLPVTALLSQLSAPCLPGLHPLPPAGSEPAEDAASPGSVLHGPNHREAAPVHTNVRTEEPSGASKACRPALRGEREAVLTSPSPGLGLGPRHLHGASGLCEDLGHLTEPTTGSVKFSSWHWKDEGWLSGDIRA